MWDFSLDGENNSEFYGSIYIGICGMILIFIELFISVDELFIYSLLDSCG